MTTIDKDFCLSSYMAFRYIYKDDYEFFDGMHHHNFVPMEASKRIPVVSATEMDKVISEQIDNLYKKYNQIGILLSGGMDSGILAAYLKPGSNAYTFATEISNVYADDINRARRYCKLADLNHHLVDIGFDDYKQFTPLVMENKAAPVSSIEPQIYKAAMLAKERGDELLIVGESADLIFGGMDQLISREWSFDAFVDRYTFLDPKAVLAKPMPITDLYERYRTDNGIDYLSFMDDVFSIESSGSYMNAFEVANMPYYDPYAIMVMRDELDLARVRNGEPKYLVRELFSLKYPSLEVPDKIPMPRPVDEIFKDWEGPARPEFRPDIDMAHLSGNQKWQLWCAELFLNLNDPLNNA